MLLSGSEHVRHAAASTPELDPGVLAWCPACGGSGREPEVPAQAAGDEEASGVAQADCWWCRGVGVLPPRAGDSPDPASW